MIPITEEELLIKRSEPTMKRKKYSRKAAAQYITDQHGIAIAAQTLANQAAAGKGPRYSLMLGRAVYDEADLDTWVDEEFEAGVVSMWATAVK